MKLDVNDLLPRDWQLKGLTIGVFDKRTLAFYQAALDKFPDAYVNVKDGVRKHDWCGYRTPDCKEGAPNSAHRRGLALDLHLDGRNAELWEWCRDNALKSGMTRIEKIEHTQGWVHVDAYPSKTPGKMYEFNP
jgi:hypothetical protein